MKLFKSHFWYNNGQRNGILFLVFIVITLQLFFFFVDFTEDHKPIDTSEAARIQKKIDSLKEIELALKQPKIYPFNPSFLTDYKGYQLGMSTTEIDRLLQHRKQGKYINSEKEFQQVTGISDSLLQAIAPYFKFPDWVLEKRNRKPRRIAFAEENTRESEFIVQDLNTATAEDLKKINGVGDKLSQRIIKYRNILGGYLINEQLYEVYYLDKEVADRVLERFQVISPPEIEKINVNTATFKEVLAIVYIDYELTKKIFDYRDEVAEIQSLEELKKIEGFPLDKFDRIALYLQAK